MDAYRNNEEVKLFCGMMDGLAFLPLGQVEEGIEFLERNVPDVPGVVFLMTTILTLFFNKYDTLLTKHKPAHKPTRGRCLVRNIPFL